MTTTYDLRVEGMSCGHCVARVEEALKKIPGVARVEVVIGSAHVEAASTVTREALIAALADVDYPAS